MNAREWVTIAAIFAILAVSVVQSIDAIGCSDRGGVIVRGMWGLECVRAEVAK